MRLKISQLPRNKRTFDCFDWFVVRNRIYFLSDSDLVTSAGWTLTNTLFTVSDDKTILSWSIDGEYLSKVCDIDTYATDFHWLTASGAADSELFALASSDGTCDILFFSLKFPSCA